MNRSALTAVIVAAATAGGCWKPAERPFVPPPDLAPAGMVRITPEKVQEDEQTVRWRWLIAGDRKWGSDSLGDSELTLTNSRPIDDPSGGGNYRRQFIVSVEARDGPDGDTTLTVGQSLESFGTARNVGSATYRLKRAAAKSVFKPLLTAQQTLPLPVEVGLYELTAERPDGTPIRQTLKLKIAE